MAVMSPYFFAKRTVTVVYCLILTRTIILYGLIVL